MNERWVVKSSPVGAISIELNDLGALTRLGFGTFEGAVDASGVRDRPELRAVVEQLEAYFEGSLRSFDLRIDPDGTSFQHQVWAVLQGIPYGETRTYGQIAEHLKFVNGQRAVGAANQANPIAIVIPCHRVIGADGSLVGYAGGLEIKRALLELEGALPPQTARLF